MNAVKRSCKLIKYLNFHRKFIIGKTLDQSAKMKWFRVLIDFP